MQPTITARLLEKIGEKKKTFWVFFECVDKILGQPLSSSNAKYLKGFTFKRHDKYSEIFIASTPPRSGLGVKGMYRLPSGEFCFAYNRVNNHNNRKPLQHGIENGRLIVGKSIVLYAPLKRRRTFNIFRGEGNVYEPEKWESLESGLDLSSYARNALILPGEQTYIYLTETLAIKKCGIYSEFKDHGIVFENPVDGYKCFDLDPTGEYVYFSSQDDVIVISTYDWKVKKVIKFPENLHAVLGIVKLKDPFRFAVSAIDGIYIFDEWVERKEVTSLLLMGREFCPASPFHKDVFPLDIFKYVLDLSLLLRTKTSSVSEFKPFPNLK